jgi:predicted hotdog family 3-hydroxylacyl-ACP dehydratase
MKRQFPAVEELLPHRPPMLLLTDVVEELVDGIVGVGSVPLDHVLVHDALAPTILGVELAAQAAGAHAALRRRATPEGFAGPAVGALVTIRRARFHVDALPAGEPLRTEVRLVGAAGPLAVYDGQVSIQGRTSHAVTCRFSTYATESGSSSGA